MKSSGIVFNRLKLLVAALLLGCATSFIQAATHYVRTAADATSWSNISGASILTGDAVEIISTDTYYFAKGTYTLFAFGVDANSQPIAVSPSLTTGLIYGGFSGQESTIELDKRALSDKDGNGIIEPWEFTNETIIKGVVPFNDLVGSNLRLITVTGGEVNGITFANHYYFGDTSVPTPSSGAIILGAVTSYPKLADDIDANAGKLTLCTVQRVRVGGAGPIMLTNKSSQVDKCLIEECVAMGGEKNLGGGAIWLNALGGKVTNSVIRNCDSKLNNTGTGKGGAIWAQHPSYDYRSDAPDCSTLIYNCLIYNNSAAAYGSGIRVEGKNAGKTKAASVINCTIVNNKTPQAGAGELELIFDGCLAVNNIVANADAGDEFRVRDARHYVSNNVYGTLIGQTVLSPGNDLVPGKSILDLKFVKPLSRTGAAGSPGDDFFDQVFYDSIRTANFRIAVAESPAVQTPGALSLQATFPSTAADATPTPVIGTIPVSDMLGESRATTNTIGAYQFVATNAVRNTIASVVSAHSTSNGIVVNGAEGKSVSLFNAAGQLIKKTTLLSNSQTIPAKTGFYIVNVGNSVVKVVVK